MHSTTRTTSRRPTTLLTAVVVSFAIAATACGGSAGDADSIESAESSGDGSDAVQSEASGSASENGAGSKPAEYGGTLIAAGEAEVANAWVPATMQCDSYCIQRARSFYDPIAAFGDDHVVHPFLAESITPNEQFTVWTIKIRDGIVFHDGTPVDADAVMFNLQATGSGPLLSAAIKDVARSADGSLVIERVDDLTFTIATGFNGDPNQPVSWPGLDAYLTGQWGLIASPTWLEAVDAGTADPGIPVGSGPFIVESYEPREALELTRNPDYWQTAPNGDQLPYLDGIEYRVIEDSEIAAEALAGGTIDIFATSEGRVIERFRNDARFAMVERADAGDTNYLMIDLDKDSPLADVRVRCAMSKALDRQEMIDTVAGGILTPANGVFSPGQQGHLDDNGFDISQDIDGAKQLIEEYEQEFGAAAITYGKSVTQVNDQIAQLLKGYWEAIGLEVEIVTLPQDQIITNALLGSPEFEIYGWRQHGGFDIDAQYYTWHSSAAAPDGDPSLNFSRIRDEVVDTGLETARTSLDPEVRRNAAETINRRFAEQCYQIPWSWTIWGVPRDPFVNTGGTVLPDGTTVSGSMNPAGFYWTHSIWLG